MFFQEHYCEGKIQDRICQYYVTITFMARFFVFIFSCGSGIKKTPARARLALRSWYPDYVP
ncbi:hypothetical protein SXCC_03948 [Gluconacetobacter sp. SXCC-1]|nr:hypothetical protein SXCC_03948 [Gluconacetobacter sp. SXCC-1]